MTREKRSNLATSLWRRIGDKVLKMSLASQLRDHLIAGVWTSLALWLLTLAPASAEVSTQLRVSRAPYQVGVPIEIQVHVTGLRQNPEPKCDADAPARGSLSLLGIVPNISTSMSIVNGKVTRSETVKFVCRYQFLASAPGLYRFGPFRLVQGSETAISSPYSLKIDPIIQEKRLDIEIEMPKGQLYIGQQVPVTIRWWLEEGLANAVDEYKIQSGLFLRGDTFHFLPDAQPAPGQQTLEIQTDEGPVALEASVEKIEKDGIPFLVLSAQRTLIPLQVGQYRIDGASVSVSEVTRWQRDFFGGRRAAQTRQIGAQDEAVAFEVLGAPTQGQPESFSGAIGRGFSFDVSADRSVVQKGDPILLTLTIRGAGNLSLVQLPSLLGPDALPKDQFRQAPGDISGEIVDGAKVFRVPVRVLEENVVEIPALPYSWFDTETKRYETTHSRPVALSVRSSHTISADQVVSRTPRPKQAESRDETQDPSKSGAGFDLSGADLAIEIEPARLLRSSPPPTLAWAALYPASFLLVGFTVWRHRSRKREDRDRTRWKKFEKVQKKRLEAAAKLPRREALTQITSLLRQQTQAFPVTRDAELEELIAECDRILYAPDTEPDAPLDPKMIQDTLRILGKANEKIRRDKQ